MRFPHPIRRVAPLALAALAGAACLAEPPPGPPGSLAFALEGSALLDDLRSLRVRVFDASAEPCLGPSVARPGQPPLADSGLLRPDTPRATLEVPAGPRTLYVEAYSDLDGALLLGTGCTQVSLAPGENRTVRIELVPAGGPDADADADADVDGDAAADADIEPDLPPDVPDGDDAPDTAPDGPDGEDIPDVEPDLAADEGGGDLPGEESTPDEGLDGPGDEGGSDGPGDEGGAGTPRLVVSEVDYDQPSSDTAEFIEIFNAGDGPAGCAGLSVVLVNGEASGGPAPYATYTLTCLSIPPGGFHLLGAATVTGLPGCAASGTQPLSGAVQNGPGDVVVLRDAGGVIDQVAYEGAVPGWGEGAPAPADPDTRPASLQRNPPGRDTGDNLADFALLVPTPCAAP